MRAVVATGYGPPEEYSLAELPAPRPGPGQLQVRIAAASINPADVRLPSGEFREVTPLTFPHVPGNDFAGTVTEVGAGVTAFRVGDEIFGQAVPRVLRELTGSSRPSLSTGSLAEYAVFEADTPLLTHRPPELSATDAAALATTGLTAVAVLATASVRPVERVLVIGATGGVGTAVVPLLAAAGAHVIATTTDADTAVLRGLGATETIPYDAYPSDVDVAVNLTLPSDNLDGVAATLRKGGRLLTITFPIPQPNQLNRDDVDLHFVLDLDGKYGGMRDVATLAAAGRLPATISREYPLDNAVQACVDFVRNHTTGKLVVRVS